MSAKTKEAPIEVVAPVVKASKRYWKFELEPKTDEKDDRVREIIAPVYFLQEKYPEMKDATAVKITFEPIFKK